MRGGGHYVWRQSRNHQIVFSRITPWSNVAFNFRMPPLHCFTDSFFFWCLFWSLGCFFAVELFHPFSFFFPVRGLFLSRLIFSYVCCVQEIFQQTLTLKDSLYVGVIRLSLSTLRRKPPHMSTRYDAWRLTMHGDNRTRSLDFEERASAYVKETLHLKARCTYGDRTRSFDF